MWAVARARTPHIARVLAAPGAPAGAGATAVLRARALVVPPPRAAQNAATSSAAPGLATPEAPPNQTTAATLGGADGYPSELRRLAPLCWKLSKGKLTVWVAISALPGYFLAVPGAVDLVTVAALASGTFLTSASAQTLNQLSEVDRDARMKRTEKRPLPTGQISPEGAALFAASSGSLGLAVLTLGATPLTAAVAATTIATYVCAYTPMKVVTPYNTHIGAISGALPTLLGFTAALGADAFASPWALGAWWLFGMQVLWQMPHFYALAWIYRADYLRGGYRMFPLTDATGAATAAMSKPYLAALSVLPWGLSAAGLASWMLPIGAVLPSAVWWHTFRAFEAKPTQATCRRFFLGSLSYLLAMLGLFTAFARPQKALADGEEGPENQAGPRWRSRLYAIGAEACPHEQGDVRMEMIGTGPSRCPLSRA